ncbi:EthD family reductase [Occallatibacter savannae]|uniref:EthD family reductase n=1 Tax=Occallatibacter savannae TaxID=1002691 RepID=UPI001EF6C2A2|nr:EthD family reductase [Occallatibacter savannae]
MTPAPLPLYSHSMVRLTVLYPATPISTFDWNYYLSEHLLIARRLLGARGLVRIEVDRGIGAFPPGTPSHYHAIGHLYFESMVHLDTALAATASDLIADQRKYYSGDSVVQVSEVVPV